MSACAKAEGRRGEGRGVAEENTKRLRLDGQAEVGEWKGRATPRDLDKVILRPKAQLRSCAPLKTFPFQVAQALLNSSTSGCGFFSALCPGVGSRGWEAATECQETAKVDTRQCSEDEAIKLTLPPLHGLFTENRGDIVPHCVKWKIFACIHGDLLVWVTAAGGSGILSANALCQSYCNLDYFLWAPACYTGWVSAV